MDTQRRFELNRKQSLERARFEADRKYRQFQAVEPENRLVARELERQWESSLKVVLSLVREYEMSKVQPLSTSDEQRQAIRSLATSLPRLWRSEFTSNSDRGNGSLKGSQCGSQKGDQLGVGDVGWPRSSCKHLEAYKIVLGGTQGAQNARFRTYSSNGFGGWLLAT